MCIYDFWRFINSQNRKELEISLSVCVVCKFNIPYKTVKICPKCGSSMKMKKFIKKTN